MTIDEKFKEWEDVFFDKFVKVSSDGCEQGSCVPLEAIDLAMSRGYVGGRDHQPRVDDDILGSGGKGRG